MSGFWWDVKMALKGSMILDIAKLVFGVLVLLAGLAAFALAVLAMIFLPIGVVAHTAYANPGNLGQMFFFVIGVPAIYWLYVRDQEKRQARQMDHDGGQE